MADKGNALSLQLDKSRCRKYCLQDFACSESTEYNEETGRTHVIFCCRLEDRSLTFVCRDPSNGVLHKEEESVILSQTAVDPHFFASNYNLAASTGFSIWPGSRFLAECLLLSKSNDCEALNLLQQRLVDEKKNCRILELGAGVGLVGVVLACVARAHVLQTDLPVLTEHAIQVNQQRNAHQHTDETEISSSTDRDDRICPSLLQAYQGLPVGTDGGWVGSCVVDWTAPLKEQLADPTTASQIDLVVACDCLWLKHLLEPVLDRIQEIFEQSRDNRPVFVCTYQNRGRNAMYSDLPTIRASIEVREWKLDCLAWHVVDCGDHHTNDLMVLLISAV